MNDYKEKIVGGWKNNDIEYKFESDGRLSIYWIRENNYEEGFWQIVNDKVFFMYGKNQLDWEGRINYITDGKLSITDQSNEVGVIDIMFRDNLTLEPLKIGLTKYIFSRFLFVFFISSSYEWISNLDKQVDNFFRTYQGSFLHYVLIILIGILAISFLTLLFIRIFTLLHASYTSGLENVFRKLSIRKIPKFIVLTPFFILPLLENEVDIEREHKKYTFPFMAFGLILIFFINGSPFINNYSAVYLNYEVPSGDGNASYKEQKTYVFGKDNTELIEKKISEVASKEYLEDNLYEIEDYNLDYYGTTRNYLFEQTAEIEGFESYNKSYKGVLDYVSCLIYFFIEKLIITIIFFLLPFLVWIGISFYKNKS
jgi:hypothetical protein